MTATTPEAPSPRKRLTRFVFRVALRLIVFTLVYVLSIGPLYWQWYKARYVGGSPWIVAFYEPLNQMCRYEPIGKVVNWYVEFWVG